MNSDNSSLDINNLQFRLTSLWGPSQTEKIEEFQDQPFMPFNRSKINLAPFNTQILNDQYQRQTGRTAYQPKHQNQQQPIVKLEQDDFSQVEIKQKVNKPYQKKTYQKKQVAQPTEDPNKIKVPIKKTKKNKIKKARNYTRTRYIQFKDSVLIKSKFQVLSELDKMMFDKSKVKNVEIEEVARTGTLREYHKNFEMTQPKMPKELINFEKYPNLANSNAQKDDKMMEILEEAVEQANKEEEDYRQDQIKIQNRKQARQEKKQQQNTADNEDEEEEEEEVDEEGVKVGSVPPPNNYTQVYVTDTLLTGLMTLNNSEFPWDITVVKDGNHLIMDKFHQDQQSYLDYQTMHENSTTANVLPTDESEVQKICLETTQIQKTLLKQTTNPREDSEEWDYGEENANELEGFGEEKVGFRYIKVNLDDQIVVNVRAQVDAFQFNSQKEELPILVRAFNEYAPSKTDWRKNLQQAFGALTSQLQIYNLCQMNKWLMQMYLTDAEKIKIAYVSRHARQPDNANKHQILKVINYNYEEMKSELKIKPEESWNIVKFVVNYLKNQEDGKYLLLKHAYKSSLKVYYIPENDDSEDDEDDVYEGEEQEGEEEEESGDEEQ